MTNFDRRQAARIQLQATVTLTIGDDRYLTDANLRDLSLDGISIRSDSTLPLNTICDFDITLTGPSSTLELRGKGRILRMDKDAVALKFTELDMDSYIHLRNIVLHNRNPEVEPPAT